MHPKPAGPLNTLDGIPLYAVPGAEHPKPDAVPGAVHPKPAGPLNTLDGIPLYAGPEAVHPKPAGLRNTLNGYPGWQARGPCALNRRGRSKP